MKQGLIISGGVALIIIVCVIWAYLLFFGTPQDPEMLFANLGFGEEIALPHESQNIYVPEEITDTFIDLDSSALAQLTTRPIAGFAFIERGGELFIQYAERGVGHIYEIDLAFAQEERVLGKTFTAISDAVFAPGGSAVVLIATNPAGTTAFLETIDAASSTPHTLPTNIEHVAFMSDTKLRYTKRDDNGTNGYEYDLETEETTELFSIPFTDAEILWEGNRTFTYNRPAPHLKGGLYEVGSTLSRIGETGYGLSALTYPVQDIYIVTSVDLERNVLVSRAIDNTGTVNGRIPLTVLPEKCVFDPIATAHLWCGAPGSVLARTFQRDWYQGTAPSTDMLWSVDLLGEKARAVIDMRVETGRTIDVTDLSIDTSGTALAFKNKIDGTLWYYNTQFGAATEEIEETASSTEAVVE